MELWYDTDINYIVFIIILLYGSTQINVLVMQTSAKTGWKLYWCLTNSGSATDC